jgi:transposase
VLREAGIGLLFLPPYSPDKPCRCLGSIEPFWATLKAWIRALNEPLLHIAQALAKVFKNILI